MKYELNIKPMKLCNIEKGIEFMYLSHSTNTFNVLYQRCQREKIYKGIPLYLKEKLKENKI